MNTEEREISLLNLLIYVAKGWRGIIIWMLVMAVALGGVQYVRSLSSAGATQSEEPADEKNEKKQAEETLEQLSEEMEETEVIAVEKVIKLEEDYAVQKKYIEGSELMNINPYDVTVGRVQYWIDTDYKVDYSGLTENDVTRDIVNAYIEHIYNGKWKKTALEAAHIEIEPQYFNELFSIDNLGNSFTFIIKLGEEAQVESVVSTLKKEMEAYQDKLTDMFGKHKLNIVNESVEASVEAGIYDLQQNRKNTLLGLQESINNSKIAFTDNQKSLYEAQTVLDEDLNDNSEEKEKAETKDQEKARPGISVKYILLGAVLGAFLVCMVRAMRYILSGKLKAEDNIDVYLGVASLGYVEENKQQYKGIFGKLDAWIDGLAKRSYNDLSEEQQLQMIVSNIALYCEKGGMKNIYFNSSVNYQTDKEGRIIEMLSKRGVSVKTGFSILQDASSMENMNKTDGVVFLEKAEKSRYEDLEREIKVCKEHEKSVIGMVVLV